MKLNSVDALIGASIAHQATGCDDAGGYLDFARKLNYKEVEVLNWSSSAGDWQFLVSKNGKVWYILNQENNYPRSGFTRTIDKTPWYGTYEEVCKQIEEMYS